MVQVAAPVWFLRGCTSVNVELGEPEGAKKSNIVLWAYGKAENGKWKLKNGNWKMETGK